MKKIILSVILITVLTLTFASVAEASFGGGVVAIADNTEIIKGGILGRKMTFSDLDIKQGLSITDFESIKITKLPSSTEGTLLLAGRRVKEGAVIKRKNIPALVFIPASREVSEAEFKFTVDGYCDGCEIAFIIKFTDKVNYEPEILREGNKSPTVKTQREISLWGKLLAEDKEGDEIEFIVVNYPKNGTLKLNTLSGEYVYTPKKSYTGADSFVFVARDEWGNYSKAEEVTISVTERMSEVIYRDMTEREEYNAAVIMTALGVMGGKSGVDGSYFNPDENVSRAEFLAMAMKALGIKPNQSLTETYFDDNNEIPLPLVSYVATAQNKGLIDGKFTNGKLLFRPNEKITKYEAAVILSKVGGLKSPSDVPTFADIYEIPVWARDEVYALCSAGIFDSDTDKIEGKAILTRAECAVYLYKMISQNS